jgi:Leucine-rich repeat (LRR) protein
LDQSVKIILNSFTTPNCSLIYFLYLHAITTFIVAIQSVRHHEVAVYNKTGKLPENLLEQYRNVTSLVATHLNLTTLSRAFRYRYFDQLKDLDLSHNKLTVIEKYEFTGMRGLETLSLANNLIEQLDDQALLGLGKLQRLNLSHNKLTSFTTWYTFFYVLINLNELKLDNNQLKTIDFEMFGFSRQLLTLELQNNEIEEVEYNGFRFDQEFVGRKLNLSNNNLKDVNFLGQCKKMQNLDLSNNINMTLSEQSFEKNTDLKNLKLQNVSLDILGEEIYEMFRFILNLEQLDMGYNNLSTFNFSRMPNLKHLETVNLIGNPLQELVIVDLEERFPKLKKIIITDQELDNTTLKYLKQCYRIIIKPNYRIILEPCQSGVNYFELVLLSLLPLGDVAWTLMSAIQQICQYR